MPELQISLSAVTGMLERMPARRKLLTCLSVTIINLPMLDSFYHIRDKISGKLTELLSICKLKSPVAVIGHNLTLGKNPAFSSAFSQIARKDSNQMFRFFSVIHDFAEEWRIEQLKTLHYLESAGVDIFADIYATGVPVRYVVPGKSAFGVLEEAGFPVTLLPNPVKHVDVNRETIKRDSIIEQIAGVASIECTNFDSTRPLYYYPSRVIYRKNFLEAIFLSCIGLNSNLITGPPGFKADDLRRYKRFKEFVKRFRLPVIFNPGERIDYKSYIKDGHERDNPAPVLYTIADCALSTSVSEGFGYGLYEPYLYGKVGYRKVSCRILLS